MNGSVRRRAGRFAAALGLAGAAFALLLAAGCAPDGGVGSDSAPAGAIDGESTVDPAEVTWDPGALAGALPGLVGWRATPAGDGSLVALSPDATVSVIWSAPAGTGVVYSPLAIDADGPQVLCMAVWGSPAREALVVLGPDGGAEEVPLPDGYEGVQDAAFVNGRPFVVAYHATADTYATAIGTYSVDGAWAPISLAGDLPDYQFVERIHCSDGGATVAVILKTPGGPGDRDDEALVLATLRDAVLEAFTPAFRDDALPVSAPLADGDGVVYPRVRTNGSAVAIDLVSARWSGSAWDERVLVTGGDIAPGIETGSVVASAPGTYWLRSSGAGGHAAGTSLMRLDADSLRISPVGTPLDDIGWFSWVSTSVGSAAD